MASRYSLSLYFLCVFLGASTAHAKVHHHKWDIVYQYKSPDCYKKLMITINGEHPGPAIVAQQGDTVVVEVKNKLLTENVAIHWHGIRQIGTPWNDGTEGVTQCPIMPGENFVYRFVVDRAGTYMYHAHYGLQKSAGLYGMIKVEVPNGVVEPFPYDYDREFILDDWFHKSTYEQATGLSSIPFAFVGDPQSLLINGRGKYDCSKLSGSNHVCDETSPECSPSVLTVIPGKTYRLRLACITSLSALNFLIEGHDLTVVEADGHYVKPFVVKNLHVYSGETYSVVLKADQDPSRNYWIALNIVDREPFKTPPGTAILNYYPNTPLASPPATPPTGALWNDISARFEQSNAIRSHPNYIHPPPATSDRTIILLNTQNKIDGRVRWAINNVSLNLPHTPYLVALKRRLKHVFDQSPPPETYDYKNYDIYGVQSNPNAVSSNAIYRFEFNSIVDLILQNANTMKPKNSETHPWHIHGHDFWVLGYGLKQFDPEVDPKSYNLVDPIMKNTVPVHPYGWTAIRFRADNPGVWLFHCHIESHFYLGMGIVFEEGVHKLESLPKKIMGCGQSK